jgi:hypothetical protein
MLKAFLSRFISQKPAVQAPAEAAPPPEPAPPPGKLAGAYVERLTAMRSEAEEAEALPDLLDAMCFTLALVASRCEGPWGAGDIVRKFGHNLCGIEAYKAATAEAKEAKKAGAIH